MADRIAEQTESIGQPWKEGAESISWEQICFVRALDNPEGQIKNSGDDLVLQTAINSSRGEIPRTTIHWAINHFVSPHMAGSWEKSKAVILCPGAETVETNGKPENLFAVDTYWTSDMVVPKKSVILWFEEPPSSLKIPEGVESHVLDSDFYTYCRNLLDEDESKELFSLLNRGVPSSSLPKQEFEFLGYLYEVIDGLQQSISDAVDEQLLKMNYSVFSEDHHTYMGEKELDNAVYNLAKGQGIDNSQIHADTLFGALESDNLWGGPLAYLIQSNSLDEMQKLVQNNETGEYHGIEKFLDLTTSVLEGPEGGGKWEWTDSEKRERLIFCTELYRVLKNSVEILKTNSEYREAFANFFIDFPEINGIIKDWSEKDSVDLRLVLDNPS